MSLFTEIVIDVLAACRTEEPLRYRHVLMSTPYYGVMWQKSFGLSFTSIDPWLRTRPEKLPYSLDEIAGAD